MFSQTLKYIFRQLRRQAVFTGIHLVGLTVGCLSAMLLFLYVRHELNFDQDRPAAQRIYRLVETSSIQGRLEYSGGLPFPMPAALRTEIPDLEVVSGIYYQGEGTIRLANGAHQRVEEAYFADAEFLDLFSIALQGGVSANVLEAPGQVLLSASLANRLFGSQKAIGKTLDLNDQLPLTVAGVFPDQEHTHLAADLLVSLPSLTSDFLGFDKDSWGVSIGGATYVRLAEGQQPTQYTKALAGLVDKYLNGTEEGAVNTLLLQPLRDIHFDTRFNGPASVAPIPVGYLWVAGAIGLLILLMACFNFVNLSLAQSLRKSPEVGMRRILGASGNQLWFQYWGEALVLTLSAGLLSSMLLPLLLPYLAQLFGQQLAFYGLRDGSLWLFMTTILLLISLLAGGYPAWILARKRPNQVMSGHKIVGSRGESRLRQAMVLAQFVITLVMVCGAITVARQLDYFQNKNLGFKQDAIIMVAQTDAGTDAQLREEWLRQAGIEAVSFGLGAPTSTNTINTSYYPKGKDEQTNTRKVELKPADEHYAAMYDLQLVAGRFLSTADSRQAGDEFPERGAERSVVINETMAKSMGYPNYEQVLGQSIVLGINNMEGKIVGVTKDFHTSSLREAVPEMVMIPLPPLYYQIGVKVDPSRLASVLGYLEQAWKIRYPGQYFDYTFLDEAIAEQYLKETRTNTLLKIFAGLAIFIACLGLFGLTAIMAAQRRKEIGLRKVLGASVWGIYGLLSKDMVRLIGLALFISIPLAWWGMQQWLNGFAYRVNISPWTFAFAGILLLVIALLTVSGQAMRAAVANPVESLRSE
jgi:putative ABC transport system permease protein